MWITILLAWIAWLFGFLVGGALNRNRVDWMVCQHCLREMTDLHAMFDDNRS
jgi:hypothetical protein